VAEGLERLPLPGRDWPFPGCLAFLLPFREVGRVQMLLPPFFFDFLLGGAGGARVVLFMAPFPEASSPSAGASDGARAGAKSEDGVSGYAEAGVSGRLGVWAAGGGRNRSRAALQAATEGTRNAAAADEREPGEDREF
jgi:hypothetical protein